MADWIALLKELRHKVIVGLDACLAAEKQSGLEEGKNMAMLCVRYIYIYIYIPVHLSSHVDALFF